MSLLSPGQVDRHVPAVPGTGDRHVPAVPGTGGTAMSPCLQCIRMPLFLLPGDRRDMPVPLSRGQEGQLYNENVLKNDFVRMFMWSGWKSYIR